MSGRGFTLLPGKLFPEGFMPPWRIQHESHTCSEQSLRILMWNASYVQKHSNILQLHLTGMGRWRDPAKYQEAAIAIASAKWKIGSRPFPNDEYIQLSQIVPTCHRLEVLKFEFCLKSRFKTRHAGSWLSRLPLTKIGFDKSAGTSGWSAPISSQLMSSFVGSGLMSGPLPPAKLRSFTSLQMVHTLLRTIFANCDVKCIGRAKTPTIKWHEEWKIIQVYI